MGGVRGGEEGKGVRRRGKGGIKDVGETCNSCCYCRLVSR